MIQTLQLELRNVQELLIFHKLKFNWVSQSYGHDIHYTDWVPVEVISHVKYLEVMINNIFKYSRHADYIAAKISQKEGIIRRINKTVWRGISLQIYNAIILPHLIYCATILCTFSVEDNNRVPILQDQGMSNNTTWYDALKIFCIYP